VIDTGVRQYCETVRARLEKATDFDTKRQFYSIERIVYANDHVSLSVRYQ
jgi:hypothetical protein